MKWHVRGFALVLRMRWQRSVQILKISKVDEDEVRSSGSRAFQRGCAGLPYTTSEPDPCVQSDLLKQALSANTNQGKPRHVYRSRTAIPEE